MTPEITNWVLVVGTIILVVLGLIDFLNKRLNYLKKSAGWLKSQLRRLAIDRRPVDLVILPSGPDGEKRTLIRHIMRGTQQQLLAYEITHGDFLGTRYLVKFVRQGENDKSVSTADRELAKARWREWYQEWERQPGGFGGASGNGLGNPPPW